MDPTHFIEFIGTRNHVNWWQMTIRAVVVFLYGLVLLRLTGSRIFGKATALDIVLAMLIGSNLSRTLTADAPLLPTLVATTALVFLYWLLLYGALHLPVISWLVKGRSVLLVRDGKMDREKMSRMGVGERDLAEAMREAGIDDVRHIKEACLERDGSISMLGATDGEQKKND
ncbi:MAG: DUF421 domain-containing protein [Rhodanobacter sp.]|nr:MAG: DUF421 domain-containing protein [Rhodanobacter sp.]